MGYRGVFEEDFMTKKHQENMITISIFRFQFSVFNFLLLLQPISLGNHEALCSSLAGRNVRNFKNCKDKCYGSRIIAWAVCTFSVQGNLTTSSRRGGISATLLLYVFSSLRHGEQTTVAPDTD